MKKDILNKIIKWFWIIFDTLVIILFTILVILIVKHSGAFFTSDKLSDTTVKSNITIYDYEWFQESYEEIGAVKAMLDITVSSLEDKSMTEGFKEKQMEKATSLLLYLGEKIQQYNKKSEMVGKKYWKRATLPYQIRLKKNDLEFEYTF